VTGNKEAEIKAGEYIGKVSDMKIKDFTINFKISKADLQAVTKKFLKTKLISIC